MTRTPLQISNPRERWLVRSADRILAPLAWFRRERRAVPVARILLLRLERIGDLVMTMDAIRDVRNAWPEATIDLAVGSWNASLAPLVPGVDRVHVLTVPWLARNGDAASWGRLLAHARQLSAARYDLIINFEPDIRSNLLTWLIGAPRRVGYASGGGGAFLTETGTYDPAQHVTANARRLVAFAAGRAAPDDDPQFRPRLQPPDAARARAAEFARPLTRPLIGIHASGGRQSKQWHLDRFATAGRAILDARGGTIVLTGSPADEPLVATVRAALGDAAVVRAADLDLPDLAALLGELDLLVTGDTGPMHLAAAMGTPIVALFGPSNPIRYGPRARLERIIRVDLPCSPCGQVRLPPERCRGHVPDCLNEISVERVVDAALSLLGGDARAGAAAAAHGR